MEYLTKEARTYCTSVVSRWDREKMVEELEAICVACYDDEPESDLVDAIVDSIEAGDIEFDWSLAATQLYSHYVTMLWYDIEEIWTKEKPREDADVSREEA